MKFKDVKLETKYVTYVVNFQCLSNLKDGQYCETFDTEIEAIKFINELDPNKYTLRDVYCSTTFEVVE